MYLQKKEQVTKVMEPENIHNKFDFLQNVDGFEYIKNSKVSQELLEERIVTHISENLLRV